MNLSMKSKAYLTGGLVIIGVLILLLLIGEIILPFIFAVFLAFLLNPIVLRIQNKIKNRNLAVSSLIFVCTIIIFGVIFFFGNHIVKDTKRFISAVEIVGEEHKEKINDFKTNVLVFVDDVYESDVVQNQISSVDTMSLESNDNTLTNSLEGLYSYFDDSDKIKNKSKSKSWNSFYMVINTLIYLVFILYSYEYFEVNQKKYFGNNNSFKTLWLWKNFEIVFVNYFKQRAKVVMLSMAIFILTFSVLDLPGAIIIGVIAGLLTYAAHFHYLSLPLVSVGCIVLSIENEMNFFLFFGIIVIVFIIVSILEETIFFNKIMKSVNGMNPAVMVLSFTLWISIFGGFTGTILALPLTQLILIFTDRMLLSKSKK